MSEKKNIKLSAELINKLVNTPETGMGYHRVDLIMKNGTVIKNMIVLNSSILLIENSNNFIIEDIDDLIIHML